MPDDTLGTQGLCRQCGAPISGEQGDLCFACAMITADDHAASKDVKREEQRLPAESRRVRRKQAPTVLLLIVCAVCLGLIVWRAPAFADSMQTARPIRTGPITSAGSCDECVQNLWVYSAALGNGQALPSDLTCPASDAAYVVAVAGDVTTVSCPDPERHKLTSLSVDSERRIPEAVR